MLEVVSEMAGQGREGMECQEATRKSLSDVANPF
jgi:hypothetical protein